MKKHAKAIFNLVNDNRPHLRQWLPWVDNMLTVETFRDFISDAKKQIINGTDWAFVIIDDGILAGRIGIYNIDAQNKSGSIGYWLGHNFLGRGITTKACKAMIDYSFSELALNRIEIKCGTENFKSQAIPQNLHFKKEALIRQGEFLNDKFIDLYLYAMLKNEWNTGVHNFL